MDTGSKQAGFVAGTRAQVLLLAAILIAIGVAGMGQILGSLERLEMRRDPVRVKELPPRLRRGLWTMNPTGGFERCAEELLNCTRIFLVSTEHATSVPLKFRAQFALAPAAIEAKKYPLEDEVLEGLQGGSGVILHGDRVRKREALGRLKAHAEEQGFGLVVEQRAGMTLVKRAGA